ncbi:MAG: CDGSH iron-sulfur domain-containing protein [Coriobacteriales bacterium]|jgi:CDGSH-type Zn-finger protein|nr:CDGSH iron-sulfur domain-containing protein [Coriobacteriales bacterium]
MAQAKIEITNDGPYLVSGGLPLSQEQMVTVGDHREMRPGRTFEVEDSYALCRCGHSKNMPFCDGSHLSADFEGAETASHQPFAERAEHFEGPTLSLEDDERCAFARFCHRAGSEVWSLTERAQDAETREEAMKAAYECPAGRLQHHDKENGDKLVEPELSPRIDLLEDPEKSCSGPIYVQGGVELVGADGEAYEQRNRYALCRCGHSDNKPFCDAMHVSVGYSDQLDQ